MIEPDKNGHRSGSVARGVARQVASGKTGVRLTWILEHLRVLQASPADAREAVPETNDSAVQGPGDDVVREIARELVAWTGRTLHPAGRGRRMWSGRENHSSGAGDRPGCELASLPSAPATCPPG